MLNKKWEDCVAPIIQIERIYLHTHTHTYIDSCIHTQCVWVKKIFFVVSPKKKKNIISKVKLATEVEGDPKASFSIGASATHFPRLLHFTLDPYLIMLSVKQGSIDSIRKDIDRWPWVLNQPMRLMPLCNIITDDKLVNYFIYIDKL